jgi:hypothetical protein
VPFQGWQSSKFDYVLNKRYTQKHSGYTALKGLHPTAMGIAHRLKMYQPTALKG